MLVDRHLNTEYTGVISKMPITEDQAKVAQKKLLAQLNRPPWGRGVGISEDPPGSCILVCNVHSINTEVMNAVPVEVDGVPVRIQAVGDIEALVNLD